jgi:hypothetical protein
MEVTLIVLVDEYKNLNESTYVKFVMLSLETV